MRDTIRTPEPRACERGRLQKAVGIVTAGAAGLIALVNVLGGPPELHGDPVARMLSPQVSLVVLIGLIALLSAMVPGGKITQLGAFAATAFGSAMVSRADNLTPFIWFLLGLLLAWEYGYLDRRGELRTGIAVAAFVLAWGGSLAARVEYGITSVLAPFVAAGLIATLVWVLIVDRGRQERRRRSELEAVVAERTSELAAALEEQKLLLAEMHHRTKNNLQLVSSMLWMETEPDDAGAARRFSSLDARIQALGRVHEHLYAATGRGETDLYPFLLNYIEDAAATVQPFGLRITHEFRSARPVPMDFAIRLGLILNEIVLNAADRLAPDQETDGHSMATRTRHLRLELIEDGEIVEIRAVEQWGGCVDDAGDRVQLGIQLVTEMASRLGGFAALTNGDGCSWRVRLPVGEGAVAL